MIRLTKEQTSIINAATYDNCYKVKVDVENKTMSFENYKDVSQALYDDITSGRILWSKERGACCGLIKKSDVVYWRGYCVAKFNRDCGFIG